MLAGSQTELVKMRALFVLSQIDSDEAQQLLLQVLQVIALLLDDLTRVMAIQVGIGL